MHASFSVRQRYAQFSDVCPKAALIYVNNESTTSIRFQACRIMLILHIEMESIENISERAHALPAKFYGYRSFRPGQPKSHRGHMRRPRRGGGDAQRRRQEHMLPVARSARRHRCGHCGVATDRTHAGPDPGALWPTAFLLPPYIPTNRKPKTPEIMRAVSAGRIKLLLCIAERLMTLLTAGAMPGYRWLPSMRPIAYPSGATISRPDYTALGKIRQICPDVPIMALYGNCRRAHPRRHHIPARPLRSMVLARQLRPPKHFAFRNPQPESTAACAP